jgi:hypothetical protein
MRFSSVKVSLGSYSWTLWGLSVSSVTYRTPYWMMGCRLVYDLVVDRAVGARDILVRV